MRPGSWPLAADWRQRNKAKVSALAVVWRMPGTPPLAKVRCMSGSSQCVIVTLQVARRVTRSFGRRTEPSGNKSTPNWGLHRDGEKANHAVRSGSSMRHLRKAFKDGDCVAQPCSLVHSGKSSKQASVSGCSKSWDFWVCGHSQCRWVNESSAWHSLHLSLGGST